MRTGVHCSVRKGFVAAIQEAAALGCETFQMFTQNPRGWRTRVYADEEFRAFRKERERLGIYPVVVHSPYLPNLCTSNEALYQRSYQCLREDLTRCEKLGAEFLVIHPGAFSPDSNPGEGIKRLGVAFNRVFEEVEGNATILIENMAGGGRRLGSTAQEIAEMMKQVKRERRVGVCFDTCHAFAAGYDVSNERGADAALKEFEREIGLDFIRVFHVNDSKDPLQSRRDRHESLGKGHVGVRGLAALLNRPVFNDRAFILETPKEPAPKMDLENLRELRACLAPSRTAERAR